MLCLYRSSTIQDFSSTAGTLHGFELVHSLAPATIDLTMSVPLIPSNLRALREQNIFEMEWPGLPTTRVAFRDLRLLCPCAACVDEFTGERIVNPAMVPVDVAPASMKYSGNYALKITWSDGHDTGIYSWDYLSNLPLEQLTQLTQ